MSTEDTTPESVHSSEGLGPGTERTKVGVSLQDLRAWASVAQTRGTEYAFIGLALQWAEEADKEIGRLRAALKDANDQAERFERGWYLRGDALESIKTHCEPQPSALAAAIVATCDSGLKA